MNISRFDQCVLSALALALCINTFAADNNEEDVVPAEFQSDAQISVWVDDASLNVFVSQLATITGREASIEGDLPGSISGRFNGSMADTLAAVSEQLPVIFDMDSRKLSVVPYSARSSVAVTVASSAIDDELHQSLLANMLPGNDISFSEGEMIVSGHPSFVTRTARIVETAMAKVDQSLADEKLPIENGKAQVAEATEQTVVPAVGKAADATSADVADAAATVVDAASEVMLDETAADSQTAAKAETAYVPKPILWVTDIPGFNTF